MMLPAVCVPNASGKKPAATPAADPDDEPPGVCAGFAGLAVGPGLRVANSVVTVLPMTTPPAARVQATAAASAFGCQPRQIGEPYSLGKSAVSSTSLTPIGSPCSGPDRANRAALRAASASKLVNALIFGSSASIRARQASISSSGRNDPACMRVAAWLAVR